MLAYTYLKKYLKLKFNYSRINKKYVLILIFSIILSALSFLVNKKSIFIDNYKIKRSSVGGIDNKYDINFNIGDKVKNENYNLKISAKRYKEKEASELYEYGIDKILESLKGENEDYEHILSDFVYLHYIYDGIEVVYNFKLDDEINFEEARKYYDLVDEEGHVNNMLIEEGKVVKGKIEYYFRTLVEGRERKFDSEKYSVPVIIYGKPLTEKEKLIRDFSTKIKNNNEKTISEEYLIVPSEVNGIKVKYNEKIDFSFLTILFIGIFVIFLLEYKQIYDKKEKEKTIHEGLLNEYPSFVTKVLLYIESGMTIRNTLCKVAVDYKRDIGNKKNYCIDFLIDNLIELKVKLDNGGMEEAEYENIAKRLNNKKYNRFFNMIIQNIKNGTKELCNILKIEAEDSLQEKKNNAKKLGEEASTKLIFPLLLELMIVMLVIIVPAFIGMK